MQFFLRGQHTAVAWKGGVLVLHKLALPALEHMGVEPEVAGRFGHRIPLLCDEMDRFPFEFRGIGPASVCHHRTPPSIILSPLSRCPFLLNHNTKTQLSVCAEREFHLV